MGALRIELLNPKAMKLLKDLADLNLITINETKPSSFTDILKKLRSKSASAPSLEEITKEVEAERAKRYGK
ncbi:MAG TPA: hypothetical protein VI731_03230 [Bacteroidia bacterium]|nr:hypothetical protein [Bacteroidia bacterium]